MLPATRADSPDGPVEYPQPRIAGRIPSHIIIYWKGTI